MLLEEIKKSLLALLKYEFSEPQQFAWQDMLTGAIVAETLWDWI